MKNAVIWTQFFFIVHMIVEDNGAHPLWQIATLRKFSKGD